MERNPHSPLWNQDAIMAAGLAFAGLAVLESKLFPALAGPRTLQVTSLHFLSWKVLEWWPVLLIVSGVALWVEKARDSRRRKVPAPESGKGSVVAMPGDTPPATPHRRSPQPRASLATRETRRYLAAGAARKDSSAEAVENRGVDEKPVMRAGGARWVPKLR